MFFTLPKTIAEMQMIINIASNGKSNTFEDVRWIYAYHMASSLIDATTKDIARSIISGDLKMTTEDDVVSYLESMCEYGEYYSANEFFVFVNDFYSE